MIKHYHGIALLTCFLCLHLSSIHAQSIGFSSGIGFAHYFDVFATDHTYTEYKTGSSYYLKLDFRELSDVSIFNNMSFRLEKQGGQIGHYPNFGFCGVGFTGLGIISTTEDIEKYNLSFLTYPLSYNIKSSKFRTGFALNKTLSFTSENYHPDQPTRSSDDTFISQIDNKELTVDLVFEFQFHSFDLGHGLYLSPTYHGSLGLSPEFHGDHRTQSFRHHLGLSIIWGLKEKNKILSSTI